MCLILHTCGTENTSVINPIGESLKIFSVLWLLSCFRSTYRTLDISEGGLLLENPGTYSDVIKPSFSYTLKVQVRSSNEGVRS